jgi:UDP-N-acetylmuramoyl-tripeptide--D-alanyl-D-alanine ligase
VSGTWTAEQVAAALGVAAPGAGAYRGVSTDTRTLESGALFVALEGDRFDGHRFLADARARGAGAAVVRRGTAVPDGLPVFAVDDTLAALGALARARRRRLAAPSPVVAVTGSSGKTSVKEMIRAVLSVRFRVHATAGNLNNLVGVPLTILGAPDDVDALVIEAGASVPGEIGRLRAIIEPTIAVVTNVGHAHVEGFGSLGGVLTEKLALVEGVQVAVVGTHPAELAAGARRRTRTVVAGTEAAAELRPDAWDLDEVGRGRLTWRSATVTLPVPGAHQVENAMLALAVAAEAAIDAAAALAALAAVAVPPGRGAVRTHGPFTVIDDTYNANPDSMRRALELASWLAARQGRPLAVVVGSMLELGAESDRLHGALAADIIGRRPALIGAVGAFAPAFEAHRAELGTRLVTAPDAESLGPGLRARLQGGEVVLLKASRGVALERVLRHLV